MEERAVGIILRTRPLTETSLIVQWITRDQGRIATVAKGARRPKSPFTGKLDLFYAAEFSFVRSRRSELHTLREVSLRETNAALRQDLEKLNAAAYLAVLLEHGTERETPLPEFYDLLEEVLSFLNTRPPDLGFVLAVEAKFLELSGTSPALDQLTPSAAQFLDELQNRPLGEGALAKDAARILSGVLRRGIGMAIEKLPPQRERLLRSLGA